jgi:hypothetical protein
MKWCLFAVVLGASSVGFATPNPVVAALQYSGNGCPVGSVQGYLADSGIGYRVRFRDFVVSAVMGSAFAECRFSVKVTPQKGYQVRPKLAAFDSYARIPADGTGYLTMSYRMGNQAVPIVWERFLVPSVDPQSVHDVKEVDTPQNPYSQCGGSSVFEGAVYAQVAAEKERATIKLENQQTNLNIISWEWEQRPCCYHEEDGTLTCGDHG